eukprot:TRINITY_DN6057_c0_g1_i4.p1 TRINITY_DN6057_c0_g1~~TRINITY_DN6057_c0_g1_i4.p1  ORF type:complete len:373 (-),score=103.93 TRINITY_DN6057_c0_g1_i4:50-1168(-)
MVGVRIPITVEGGKGDRKQASQVTRRGSASFGRKPIQRKDSRQKLKSINVQIHLEAATSDGTKEISFESKLPKQPKTKKSVQISSTVNENIRKSAVANRNGTNIPVTGKSPGDSQRLFCRRQSSSRDLGLPQGSFGVMKVMSRRQSSSRDLLGLDKRRKSHGKVVIRRDSVNGLRILTHNIEDVENSIEEEINEENDALERLRTISLEEKKEFSKFESDALEAHNKYRKRHAVTSLELSKDLCDIAQEYADHLAKTNTFEHSGDPVYGENLYWSWSSDPAWVLTGDEPVDSWYDEKKGYNYAREPRDSDSGHFTQLVWAKSRHLGVGLAKSSSTGKYFVVMKYDPAGNFLGKYRENVNKPVTFGGKKIAAGK